MDYVSTVFYLAAGLAMVFILLLVMILSVLTTIRDIFKHVNYKLGRVIYHLQAIDGVLTVISIRLDQLQACETDDSDE